MAVVMLGWELGGGLGHVRSLLAVARGLAAYGHRPVFVLKNVVEPQAVLHDTPFPVLQAPVWPATCGAFRAASYADILAIRGFADPDGLEALVAAWQALIDLTGAELVVADHSPTLCLAAYRTLPVVQLGNGFSVPPADATAFPSLDPQAAPLVPPERLLAVVQEVQRRRRRPAPETLPGLFAGGTRFVRSLAELDPYRAVRKDPAVGPLQPLPEPSAPPDRPRLFAYLSAEFPGVEHVLTALSAAGWVGSAYLRGASPEFRASARRGGLEIHETLPPLAELLPRVSVVLHHGGAGVAEAALAAGRPQVLLPQHLEHELTARALEGLGVSTALTGAVPAPAVGQALSRLLTGSRFSASALAWGETLAARGRQALLGTIVARCLECLSEPEPPTR